MSKHAIGVPNRAGWVEQPLSEVCYLISRGTAPVYVENSPVRAIGQRCVRNSGFDPVSARNHDSSITKVLRAQPGDILLNSTGTGTIGRSCVFQENGDFIVDGHVTVLRTTPAKADPRWINALLRSSWGQQHLESHCYTGSTNQIELSRAELISTSIPLPPVSEQRRIAETFDVVDEQIDMGERLIVKLKLAKQGILNDLLFCGASRKYWRVVTVSQICVLGRGKVMDQQYIIDHEGPYPVYSSQSKNNGEFGRINSFQFEGPHVTWTTDGAYAGTVFYRDGRFSCTNVCGILSPKTDDIYMKYLSLALQARTFQYVSYVGNPKLMNNIMAKIAVPLPPMGEQISIAQSHDSYVNLIEKERSGLQKLRTLKQALMEDLLTGRARVPIGADM